jgi:hypothetical protein
MKHEYHNGPKAGENFKKLATVLLQKPKISCGSEEKTEGKNWLWGTGCWLLSRIAPSFLKRVRRLARTALRGEGRRDG